MNVGMGNNFIYWTTYIGISVQWRTCYTEGNFSNLNPGIFFSSAVDGPMMQQPKAQASDIGREYRWRCRRASSESTSYLWHHRIYNHHRRHSVSWASLEKQPAKRFSGIFASLFSWGYHVYVDSMSERFCTVFICNTKAFRYYKYSNWKYSQLQLKRKCVPRLIFILKLKIKNRYHCKSLQ